MAHRIRSINGRVPDSQLLQSNVVFYMSPAVREKAGRGFFSPLLAFPQTLNSLLLLTMFACCLSGREYEDDTLHETARPQTTRPPSDEMSLAPKPVTGLRKPSNAAQKRPSQSITASSDNEPPLQYLYFGDNSTYPARNAGASNTGKHASASNSPRYSQVGQGNPSGRDNSGYLATGLNNNSQMGYSNITYGGSLQYNFAGTQPIGLGT